MDKSFLEYFRQFAVLSLDEIKMLFTLAKIKNVAAGEMLVREGELNKNAFIVASGLLRTFVMTPGGEERTVMLTTEKMPCGSYASILLNKPSSEYIQAVEKSRVIIMDTEKTDKLAGNHPWMLKIKVTQLKSTLADAVERIHFYTVFSPEERFLELQKKQPELLQRVPQKYLASYIGVTEVSLSRIKSRLSKNGK